VGRALSVDTSLVLVLSGVLLTGCSYGGMAPVESASRSPARKSSVPPAAHVVKRGDTLYSIAWRYRFDYRRLASWNAIREPYTIYPGQKLRLSQPPRTAATRTTPKSSGTVARKPLPPPGSAKSKSTQASGSPAKSASKSSKGKKTASAGSPRKAKKEVARAGNAPVKRWYWPAKGKVVTPFSRSGGKGIDIAGKFGQSIVAASNGKVVYSGSGLIGYGQLIIVKHNKRYLSAYAHNNKILVKEGDTVRGGQRIAEMGRSGSNRAMLHFEIRRDGKPIDPIRYLPK
jgi:lipoprotein NlpD